MTLLNHSLKLLRKILSLILIILKGDNHQLLNQLISKNSRIPVRKEILRLLKLVVFKIKIITAQKESLETLEHFKQ